MPENGLPFAPNGSPFQIAIQTVEDLTGFFGEVRIERIHEIQRGKLVSGLTYRNRSNVIAWS